MATKTFTSVGTNTITQTVAGFSSYLDDIYADLAMQSKTRWLPVNKTAFMQSVLLNTAPSKFILCDIESCKQHAKLTGDKESYDYYNQFSGKYVFLNLDSNNRTLAIAAFFKNQVVLEEGVYVIDGSDYTVDNTSNTFETMPEGLKAVLMSRKITIEVITRASLADLCRMFLVVNDGVRLNAAELRNPILTLVCEEIRSLAQKYEKAFVKANIFTQNKCDRRAIDDFFAGLFYFYINGIESPITAKSLDAMYLDADSQKLVKNFSNTLKVFLKIVSKDLGVFKRENSLLDLFVLYTNQIRNSKKLIDDKGFVKGYVEAYAELLDDDTEYQYNDNGRSASFSELLRSREFRFNKLRNRLINKVYNTDTYFIDIDKKRTATSEQKLIAANRQGWVTPEGKNIPMGEVLSDKFEGGHIIPHGLGGKTEQDNLVIQTKEDNRKLGMNVVENA
jgi:hypothetical protein